MKLMIVDDNESMRLMIRNMVAQPSDSVSECSDGRDVVETFQRELPDVVLMDLQMQNVGGIAATRSLKKKFPNARIIIVSNFNEQEYRDEARDAGAASYFTKENLIQLKQFIHQ
ncbi:MAG: response regulator transcription factor [Bacteroidetes bacterium]|nr:response regulator transcription factor [Bacteroidota bacterium]